MPESVPAPDRCRGCGGSGWMLDCRINQSPVMLELIECVYPDCVASGRKVEHLALKATGDGLRFTRVVRLPGSDQIVAVAA